MAIQWISERWDALKVGAGVRWGFTAILVSGAVAKLDWIYEQLATRGVIQSGAEGTIFGFPSWILGLLILMSFVAWWMLESTVSLKRQIRDGRIEIARLREKGVDLRNDGRSKITTTAQWLEWNKATLDWHAEVRNNLEKISVADAVWWNTLDVVPPPRLLLSHEFKSEHGTAEHAKRYNEHDFQVKRLGKMIRDLWGRQ